MSYDHNNLLPNYKDLQQLLISHKTELSPAECQGLALGLLVWGQQARAKEKWAETIVRELNLGSGELPTKELTESLQIIYEASYRALQDQAFGLKLFLPSIEVALKERALALSQWCRGFMFGLGLMEFDDRMLSNPVINEAIQDISQIINLEPNSDDEAEVGEKALFELEEYLKMATLLIYAEITDTHQESGKSVYGYH